MMADVVLVAAGLVVGWWGMLWWVTVRVMASTPAKRMERFVKLEHSLARFWEKAGQQPRWAIVLGVGYAMVWKSVLPAALVALMWAVWR